MVERITFSPDPPQHGKSLIICYTFPGPGSVHLKVTFVPGGTTIYPLDASEPCVSVSPVPDDATMILVEDLDGGSAAKEELIA